MYRLTLHLPFDVTLVLRNAFETKEAAQAASDITVDGFVFEVTAEEEVPLDAVVVPLERANGKSTNNSAG